MMLTFYVENQLHERVYSFSDDGLNSFLNLCRRCAEHGRTVLEAVDPYADTMFNVKQLEMLLKELDALERGNLLSGDEAEIAVKVNSAALHARGLSGYLFIAGD
ncbi:hypothetical protein [Sphaerisporangium sp. NPDC051011]|uniref:hypothetical protein n=1 Tax=Sphaerisporangium sp. NPDC051011 TaxID=3155792 RepID=UPI00340E3A5A